MERVKLVAPLAGWLTSIREVPDPVFADELMGVGLAVDPTEGLVAAPCDATVILVSAQRHSVTLRTDEGAELLIHVGLETVALQGRGFEVHVRNGDRVSAGNPLISFDLDAVGLEAKSLMTPILLTNAGDFQLSAEPLNRLVERGDLIGWIERAGVSKPVAVAGGDAVRREVVVRFQHGLHARPAARIADCAKRHSSEVTISLRGKTASARSPVALMALNAGPGDQIEVKASGPDGLSAIEEIMKLLETGEATAENVSVSTAGRPLAENAFAGVCGLAGVAIGTAVHWRRQVTLAADRGRGIAEERSALEEARASLRSRLQALGCGASGAASTIALAHIGLLDDEELNAAAAHEIDRGRSAARAWQIATEHASRALQESGNRLLQERVADLNDIAAQLTAALVGEPGSLDIELPEGTILLADELLPSELLSLPRERIAGLAMSGGGPTSHVAIIAASLAIPTMVAMGPQLSRIPEGARVLLDSGLGVLVVDPDEQAQARAAASAKKVASDHTCVTSEGERVSLLANLGSLSEVEPALAAGAEGCGLLRTEFVFLDRSDAPSAEEQRSTYQAIADALGGRQLTIRTLDIGGDKPVPYVSFPKEQNPALGARGIRTQLFNPELLEAQLRAIAEVSASGLRVMLPMVSSVAEFRAVRRRFHALGKQVSLGVMVETPASALIADQLAKEADFLSIGTNDLAQYTLAMDRTNPLLAASIDALHPAVLSLIAMTAAAARRAGKPVSVCGNLAAEPLGALLLIGFRVRVLSAPAAALPAVRSALARVSTRECMGLADRALTCQSADEVRAHAAELLNAPGKGDAR